MKYFFPPSIGIKPNIDLCSPLPRKLQEQFHRVGFLDPACFFCDLISALRENDNGDIDGTEEVNNPEKIISYFWNMCDREDLYRKKNFPQREELDPGQREAYELLFIAVVYLFRAKNIFRKLGKCEEYFSYVAIAHYWLGRGEERINFLDNFRMELPVREVEEDYKEQERIKAGIARHKKTAGLKNIVKYLYITAVSPKEDDAFWGYRNWGSFGEAVSKIYELLNDNHEELKKELSIDISSYADIRENIEDWIREIPLYSIYINKERKEKDKKKETGEKE